MDNIGGHLVDISRSDRYNSNPSDANDCLPLLFNDIEKTKREIDKTIGETSKLVTFVTNYNQVTKPEKQTNVT
jgi:hypothetical protein